MQIVKAPNLYKNMPKPWLFLAGTIEGGIAENWQARVERDLADQSGTILNPRRDDWDSSWAQSIDNAQFRTQVEWELAALESSDLILLYFSPGTKSPISLLELGLFHKKSPIVCCPEGFWRKGNIDIVCHRYGLDRVETLDALIAKMHARLNAMPAAA
ncbi:MAG: nucleoside 2-deoxyribosyltransferase domain-containing protein [Pseudomonadota bacterium]|nr:nucleoside 2-deoxyribosyltransferase domain-containing protein [Pseudomonadota bacterium]